MKTAFLQVKELNRKLRYWRKSQNYALTKLLYDKRLSSEPFEPSKIKKILLLRWDDKIGDMVVGSVLFREIKKVYPDIHLAVLAGPNNQTIIARNPHVDEIILLKGKSKGNLKAVTDQVRQQGFDLIIDLSTGFPARELKFLAKAQPKHVMGLLKHDYNIYDLNVGKAGEPLHSSAIYRDVLQQLGIEDINPHYELFPDPDLQAKVERYFADIKESPIIAFNLYGSSVHRQFKPDRAVGVVSSLLAAFPDSAVVFLNPPNKKNEVLTIQRKLNDKRVHVYPDIRTIDDTIALIGAADIVISPDTSVVHLAVALDRKLVGIYADNPSNFAMWHPNSVLARVVFNRARTREFERVNVGDFDDQELITVIQDLLSMSE